MEDVDYPRAWLRLKAYVGQERGHGSDDLLAEMSRIEVECSEAHRDARMTRKGEGESKRHRSTSKDRPPRDRAAEAAQTRAPDTAHPLPQEGQGNGNGHRHEDQRAAAASG